MNNATMRPRTIEKKQMWVISIPMVFASGWFIRLVPFHVFQRQQQVPAASAAPEMATKSSNWHLHIFPHYLFIDYSEYEAAGVKGGSVCVRVHVGEGVCLYLYETDIEIINSLCPVYL